MQGIGSSKAAASTAGLATAFLGLVKGHAILAIFAASSVVLDPSRLSVSAADIIFQREPAKLLLDSNLSDESPIKFDLSNASPIPAMTEPATTFPSNLPDVQFLSQKIIHERRAAVKRVDGPVKFNQPVVSRPVAASPSKLPEVDFFAQSLITEQYVAAGNDNHQAVVTGPIASNPAQLPKVQFLSQSLINDHYAVADVVVSPVKFSQPGSVRSNSRPSYLNAPPRPNDAKNRATESATNDANAGATDDAADEEVPTPSYLDEETRELTVEEQLAELNQRLIELEAAKIASEDATRTIIRRSFAERGSNITDAVVFGGTLEALTFWADDFDGVDQSDIVLDTAELDFEITVNEWVLGSLILEYVDGDNFIFPTTEDDEVLIDRFNIDTAFITVGNTANYPLFGTFGRIVVPFGISTGDPVADVLTIIDPLTVEVFETREDVVMIGFEGPTCCPPPAGTPIPAPPPPRPMLFNPLARRAATTFCSYCPCYPPVAPPIEYLPPPTCLPPITGAIYFFNGDTFRDPDEDHIEHMGGTLGYRTRGVGPACTPWSIDIDFDVISSVFDSQFLEFEYRTFLDQIGYQPGMAAHAKTSVGPFAFVAEWNAAISAAEFIDDSGTPISIKPEAWQVQVAYQLDWNRYVEVIGAQGTYVVFGYSESSDLAGVTKSFGDPLAPTLVRVGTVPERRLSAGIGEWVLPGLRFAFEYSHAWDYDTGLGTGNSSDGVFMQVTYEW